MLLTLRRFFWDDHAAYAKLEQLVWPNGPVCPHCGATERIGAVTGKGSRVALKYCGGCQRQFRVTIGTMFENSHIPLYKWFQASFLLTAGNRRISPHQLHLRLDVTNKTALTMVRRLDEVLCKKTEDSTMPPERRRRARWPVGSAITAFIPKGTAVFEEREVPWNKQPGDSDWQVGAFIEAARELDCSQSDEKFDEVLRQLASWSPPSSVELDGESENV